jgi:hypothetical protein
MQDGSPIVERTAAARAAEVRREFISRLARAVDGLTRHQYSCGLKSPAAAEQKDQQGDNQDDTEDSDPATGTVRRVTVVTAATAK